MPPAPRGFDPWTADYGSSSAAIIAILRKLSALDEDQIARLAIAYQGNDGSSFRRFLQPALVLADDALCQAVDTCMPLTTARGWEPERAKAVARGAARAALFSDYLKTELTAADAERLLDLMGRPWVAASGLGRYGSRTPQVRAFVDRMRLISPDHRQRIARQVPKSEYGRFHVLSPTTSDGVSLLLALTDLDLSTHSGFGNKDWQGAVITAADSIIACTVDDERHLDWWTWALQPGWVERLRGWRTTS